MLCHGGMLLINVSSMNFKAKILQIKRCLFARWKATSYNVKDNLS